MFFIVTIISGLGDCLLFNNNTLMVIIHSISIDLNIHPAKSKIIDLESKSREQDWLDYMGTPLRRLTHFAVLGD